MNHNELKLARKLLNLSEAESATYLGEGMNVRTWDFYERNHISNYGVKPYISEKLYKLLKWRKNLINNALLMIKEGVKPIIVHYNDDKYFNDFLTYKAHNAATITLNVDYGFDLIIFDEEDYQSFLKQENLDHSQAHIALWATKKFLKIKELEKELDKLEKLLNTQKANLMRYCDKTGFESPAAFKFINLLTTISQKNEENFEERLTKFLEKILPSSLYLEENEKIRLDFIQKTKEYLETLKSWASVYHQTKALIKGIDDES